MSPHQRMDAAFRNCLTGNLGSGSQRSVSPHPQPHSCAVRTPSRDDSQGKPGDRDQGSISPHPRPQAVRTMSRDTARADQRSGSPRPRPQTSQIRSISDDSSRGKQRSVSPHPRPHASAVRAMSRDTAGKLGSGGQTNMSPYPRLGPRASSRNGSRGNSTVGGQSFVSAPSAGINSASSGSFCGTSFQLSAVIPATAPLRGSGLARVPYSPLGPVLFEPAQASSPRSPTTKPTSGTPCTPGMPGVAYVPKASDAFDVQIAVQLTALGPEAAASLRVRRIDMGRYEIDGRRVSLRWRDFIGSELIAVEDDVPHSNDRQTLLPSYLRQAARIAKSLRSSGACGRLPKDKRLSFADVGVPSQEGFGEDERLDAMFLACQQAKLRACAVDHYQHNLQVKS